MFSYILIVSLLYTCRNMIYLSRQNIDGGFVGSAEYSIPPRSAFFDLSRPTLQSESGKICMHCNTSAQALATADPRKLSDRY